MYKFHLYKFFIGNFYQVNSKLLSSVAFESVHLFIRQNMRHVSALCFNFEFTGVLLFQTAGHGNHGHYERILTGNLVEIYKRKRHVAKTFHISAESCRIRWNCSHKGNCLIVFLNNLKILKFKSILL